MAEQKRTVGTVTGATTAGGGLGAALSQIAVEFFPRLENVEAAVTVVLTVALALVAGYLVPPKDRERVGDIIGGGFAKGGQIAPQGKEQGTN